MEKSPTYQLNPTAIPHADFMSADQTWDNLTYCGTETSPA